MFYAVNHFSILSSLVHGAQRHATFIFKVLFAKTFLERSSLIKFRCSLVLFFLSLAADHHHHSNPGFWQKPEGKRVESRRALFYSPRCLLACLLADLQAAVEQAVAAAAGPARTPSPPPLPCRYTRPRASGGGGGSHTLLARRAAAADYTIQARA